MNPRRRQQRSAIGPAPSRASASLDWTPRRAEVLAEARGIRELTDRHWRVITLCREEAARFGRSPDLDRVRELARMSREELHLLFPGEPAVTAALLSGLGPPVSRDTEPSVPGSLPREDLS